MSVVIAVFFSEAVAALVFFSVRLLLKTQRREQVRRRMTPYLAVTEPKRRGRTPSVIAEHVAPRAEAILAKLGVRDAVALQIDRAGIDAGVGAFVCLDALVGFAAFVMVLSSEGLVIGVLTGVVAAVLPWLALRVVGQRRSRKFELQLPEILDTLAASLRAGHGFDHGLQTVADDVAEPAKREFGRVVAEVHLGRSLDDALAELGRRIKSADLQFILDAIAIQRQVGGSLAELFDLVAQTVRSREQFRRNLKAITGMVRTSANVLTTLPIAAAVLLTLLNPAYMSPLWHTSSGHLMALIALTMVLCGSFVLRRVGAVKW
jgi:tight adherence protein B